MYTVKEDIEKKTEVKKSNFICIIKPCQKKDEALNFFQEIRNEHKDARHVIPVYVIGDNAELKWASDDGEPKGTAGLPILTLLDKRELSNVMLVVVRYFGGIKLGASNLLRAYKNSVVNALEEVELIKIVRTVKKEITVKYQEHKLLKSKILEEGGKILSEKFGEDVVITFEEIVK